MRSLARSLAISGDVKHARPFMATLASYWLVLLMSYSVSYNPKTHRKQITIGVVVVMAMRRLTTGLKLGSDGGDT